VFQEFQRLDPAAADGHGLGLAIGRRVARLLGGDLTVGDAELGGAAFTLWLPAPDGESRG
jgi:signal transduction histidine kinase